MANTSDDWQDEVESADGRYFTGVKVFSATLQRDRDCLGERITNWLGANHSRSVVDVAVTQSSDHSFHCITITLFFQEQLR
jgi:hypothetical protein